jgi:hypothetical protein
MLARSIIIGPGAETYGIEKENDDRYEIAYRRKDYVESPATSGLSAFVCFCQFRIDKGLCSPDLVHGRGNVQREPKILKKSISFNSLAITSQDLFNLRQTN